MWNPNFSNVLCNRKNGTKQNQEKKAIPRKKIKQTSSSAVNKHTQFVADNFKFSVCRSGLDMLAGHAFTIWLWAVHSLFLFPTLIPNNILSDFYPFQQKKKSFDNSTGFKTSKILTRDFLKSSFSYDEITTMTKMREILTN